MEHIRERLLKMQDLSYKQFQSKLMPTVDPERIIGVRTPDLRSYAKELQGTKEAEDFLKKLPHRYYEEDNLHGLLTEKIKDFEECIEAIEAFLPYVDNWATCDMLSPKVFLKQLPRLEEKILQWLSSEHTYTVRFGVNQLMKHYLGEAFEPKYLEWAAKLPSEEYYIRMAVAWYFATALAKQYEATLPYLTEQRLERWTHNKTIQKAIESYRITEEQKAFLRTLKIK